MSTVWWILFAAAVGPLLLAVAAAAGTLLVLIALSIATNPHDH